MVTSVPALPLNAVFGSRIAPSRSACSARCRRIDAVLLVHGVAARNQRHNAAGPQFLERFGEEVIVNGARQNWCFIAGSWTP